MAGQSMFLESRFERAIGRLCVNKAIPLRLKLWNGRHIDPSPAPTVTVIVPKASALRYFISPDLAKLGEAFVEGHIRVEGSIHEVFRVAERLARAMAANTRAGFHRVAGHSRERDRKAIEYHYDVSNELRLWVCQWADECLPGPGQSCREYSGRTASAHT